MSASRSVRPSHCVVTGHPICGFSALIVHPSMTGAAATTACARENRERSPSAVTIISQAPGLTQNSMYSPGSILWRWSNSARYAGLSVVLLAARSAARRRNRFQNSAISVNAVSIVFPYRSIRESPSYCRFSDRSVLSECLMDVLRSYYTSRRSSYGVTSPCSIYRLSNLRYIAQQ